MPKVTILSSGRSRATVLKHDDTGTLVYSNEFKPTLARDQKHIATAIGCSHAQFVGQIGKYLANTSNPLVFEMDEAQHHNRDLGRFLRRHITGRVVGEFDTFAEAAAGEANSDHLIVWESLDSFACLDIDYHDRAVEDRPTVEALETFARCVQPSPAEFHVSRGRGLHLFYRATESLKASHLAAAAAMWVVQADRSATVEIKKDSRVPVYPHHPWYQSAEIKALTSIIHQTSEDSDAGEYLQSHGLVVGQRYPHTKCPIAPDSDEKRDPVIVFEHGIYCHSCAAKGGGYFSFGRLSPASLAVKLLVKSFTHWVHASLVLADRIPLPEKIARLAYEALLIREHGPLDPRIPRVFTSGQDMIRADGRWVGSNWKTTYRMAYASSIISELPAVQNIDGEPIRSAVDRFRQDSADLSSYGYFPVVPIRGARIYGEHLSYPNPNRVSLLTHADRFANSDAISRRPRYIRPAKRMPIDRAWAHLEQWFPGVNRELIELLIAAKGIAEAQVGLPPFIMITGPSGSGKSGSIHIAAGIVADTATEFEFGSGTERTRQALLEAIDRGTYAVVNEVFKPAALKKLGGRAAIDPILNFTPNSTSHKLFVGPVQLGRLPVLCLTDTHCPADVYSDVQIGRRVVYCRLPYRIEWERPAVAAGGQSIDHLRFFDEHMPDVANAILSDIIDRFFSEPMVFVDIARSLGFETLERTTEFADDRLHLRTFFDAVCAAPGLTPTESARLPGPGWKKISRNGESDLDTLWLELCDGEGDGFARSRACEEADWSQVLGLSRRRIDFKVSRKSPGVVFVRFLEPTKDGPKVNEELIDAQNGV